MSLLRKSVLAIVVLLLLASSLPASALNTASGLSYTTSSTTFSGYSRTWKDPLEPDYYVYCVAYYWDDIYNTLLCSAYIIEKYLVYVYGELDTPASQVYQSSTRRDLRDANYSYASSVTSPAGLWRAQGLHQFDTEYYYVDCSWNFCLPGYLIWSGSAIIGNTQAEHTIMPFQISRYSTVTLNESEIDSTILAGADGATTILQANDGSGDVACPISVFRSGAVSVFSSGDGSIDDTTELDAVLAIPGRVHVVADINWCRGPETPPFTIVGCSSGAGMAVVRTTGNLEGSLWAHEYGHNQSLLLHNPNPGYVMYDTLASNNRKLVQAECDAMRHPLN